MGRTAFTSNVPASTGPIARMTGMTHAVPAAAKPGARKRKMLGFEVEVDGVFPVMFVEVDPHNSFLTMNSSTYAVLQTDAAAVQDLAAAKAEAVRQMKVTMWEGAAYAPKADPKRKPQAASPAGIKALVIDLQRLTVDLSGLDATDDAAVTAAAARYGKLRDTMADLRAAFTEAEGSLDLLQDLLVQKMGLD